MGIVSGRILSIRSGWPELLRPFMPRSDNARLMDLVKLRGAVLTFRRSGIHNEQGSTEHVVSTKAQEYNSSKDKNDIEVKGRLRIISTNLQ